MNQEIINIQNITDNHFQFLSEWKEIEFSKILVDESISYGIVQPGSHSESNSVPIIRVNNIKSGYIKTDDVLKVDKAIEEKYLRTRLQGGELLITVVGSIGECAIVPENLKGWNVARAVSVARIQDGYDKRFIKYSFKTDDLIFQMYGNTNDTVQPTLNLSSLKTLKFNIPPLPEQRAIASILSSLDDKIDLLHRQNATIEAMAETLFRQWFVEEAKEDWEEGTLEQLVETANTGLDAIRRAPIVEEETGIKCLRIQDISQDKPYQKWGNSKVTGNDFDKARLRKGDIIMARTCSPGIVFYAREDINAVFNNGLARIRPNLKKTYSIFLYYLFKTEDFIGHIYGISDGTSVQLNMKLGDLLSYKIQFPPKEIQDRHFPIFQDIDNRLLKNKTQILTLTALRDTLLPKLMSGEVRVEM